jgi:type IV pilus assembly protein PilE
MIAQSRSRARGFTLIELMIVIVVIAILGAIAFPSYLQYTRKAKRAEGKAALMDAAQKEEAYYTTSNPNGYTAAAALPTLYGLANGATLYSGNNHTDPNSAYTITIAPSTDIQSYTLTATQNGNFSDPTCGNLTLTNTGIKGMTGGTSTTVSDCW